MTERHANEETLRQRFQALAESTAGECSPDDLDRIWRAVDGELPAVERRALVERMAVDPAFAEAWRVAHALRQGNFPAPVAGSRRREWVPMSWWSIAAVTLLAASVVLVVSRRDRPDGDILRDAGGTHIESLISTDAALPRDAFRLRWSTGPAGARYQVRITTEDLQVLTTVPDLTEPGVTIDPAALAGMTAGSRVLWQVEVMLPGGDRATSQTFVARLR